MVGVRPVGPGWQAVMFLVKMSASLVTFVCVWVVLFQGQDPAGIGDSRCKYASVLGVVDGPYFLTKASYSLFEFDLCLP